MCQVSRNLSSTKRIHKMVVLSLKGFQRSMTQWHSHNEVLESVGSAPVVTTLHLETSWHRTWWLASKKTTACMGWPPLVPRSHEPSPLDPSLRDLLPKNFVSMVPHPLFQCHPRSCGWPALQTHCSLLPVLKIESYAKVEKKSVYEHLWEGWVTGRRNVYRLSIPDPKCLESFLYFEICAYT